MTIRLRAMEPEDLDVIYNIENDLDLWTVGYANAPYSRYLLHDYVANATSDIYADRQLRLMAENDEGEVVGIVDLSDFEPRHNRAEMGLVVRKEYRNRGYAKQIVEQLIQYSRRVLHLHQVYCVISVDNEAACGLFRSLSFRGDQRLEDWLFDGEKYSDAMFFHYFL